ncbi:replication protein A 70 kDa DNA-binding subunit C-like protein [Tanacetum coccineum]
MSVVDRRLNITSNRGTSSNKATLDESASAKEDVSAVTGQYLSTDMVVSDARGNAIHCSARSNVAHNFIKLKEGVIYCIKNFVVHPNKDEYRIRKYDVFMLEFNGATSARKSLAKGAGFARHPFQLVKLDSVELTDNKYMIDKLYLLSSSSTQIFDDPNIPALKELRSEIRLWTRPSRLCQWTLVSQGRALLKTFCCGRATAKMKTRNGQKFLTCGGENCKKGVGRKLEGWWCDACEKEVKYHILRYRLELGISDATSHVVVVMFDETTSELVKCSADSLAQSNEEVNL